MLLCLEYKKLTSLRICMFLQSSNTLWYYFFNSLWWTTVRNPSQGMVGCNAGHYLLRIRICDSVFSSTISAASNSKPTITWQHGLQNFIIWLSFCFLLEIMIGEERWCCWRPQLKLFRLYLILDLSLGNPCLLFLSKCLWISVLQW